MNVKIHFKSGKDISFTSNDDRVELGERLASELCKKGVILLSFPEKKTSIIAVRENIDFITFEG